MRLVLTLHSVSQTYISKQMFQQIKNFFKIISIKKDEAIKTCLENNISLTDENIKEVREILNHKKKVKLLDEFKKKIKT